MVDCYRNKLKKDLLECIELAGFGVWAVHTDWDMSAEEFVGKTVVVGMVVSQMAFGFGFVEGCQTL